jgi:bis(5'-nucleosidyl)-tetraphosphatase
MEHEKSCGAVIFRVGNGTRYLLLHYEAGHWDFVKGHVEKGESEEETVGREILEETGLKNNTFLSDFRERIDYFYRRRSRTVSKEVIFYLVKNVGEEQVRISGEHVGYQWLPYREALERLTYKNAKETLRKAEEYLQRVGSIAASPPLDSPRDQRETQ